MFYRIGFRCKILRRTGLAWIRLLYYFFRFRFLLRVNRVDSPVLLIVQLSLLASVVNSLFYFFNFYCDAILGELKWCIFLKRYGTVMEELSNGFEKFWAVAWYLPSWMGLVASASSNDQIKIAVKWCSMKMTIACPIDFIDSWLFSLLLILPNSVSPSRELAFKNLGSSCCKKGLIDSNWDD